MQLNTEQKIWLMNMCVFGLTEMALHPWTLVLLKLSDSIAEESNDQLLTETHIQPLEEKYSWF